SNFIERSILSALSFLRDSVFSDEYSSKKGFLQARDPRIKLLSVLFFLVAVMFSRSIYFIIGMYAFCLVLAGVSSIRLGFFLKRTWVFIPLFSLFIAIPAILDTFTPGEPLLTFRIFTYYLSVTRQGIASAGIFLMRVITSVSFSVLLVLTTKHYSLLKVLRVLKVPQVFVMTLGMCYRYIYLFIEIIQHTYLAIKSRVGSLSSTKKGQGIVAWNIASLWQRSYHLNTDVYNAMLSRGYTGEYRTLDEFCLGAADWIFFVFASLLFITMLIIGKY
ncbi:MAG: cobalt ECF transporter T component CbiQ, partial [Candidatus Omnitrophota bacterium]